MSAGCVRWVLSRTARAVCGGGPAHWTPRTRPTTRGERHIVAFSRRWSPFSTAADDTEQAPKKKKQDPGAAAFTSVGRNIRHLNIQLLSEEGEDLGTMHRKHAIGVMDEKGLKVVLLNGHRDPPLYQLMSSAKIHEEQMKQRDKQKSKAAPVQVKELNFSYSITDHDLATKLKQVKSWLDKNHHVKITLRSRRMDPATNLESILEKMVEQIDVMVGFVSAPKAIRGGQAAMCVLRPPSAKELSQKVKSKAADTSSKERTTAPVSNTDTTEESLQQ